MKKKFILEFDEAPALVFVQKNLQGGIEIYQDGEPVQGMRSIEIRAGVENVTTHRIEYVTGATSKGDR